MAVLDTATIIDLGRRATSPVRRRAWQAVRARLAAGETLTTTRFNVAELYTGIELARDSSDEAAKVAFALRWLAVLEFDDRGARAYGKLFSFLQPSGRLPADMDLLIASVAVANGHSLVTRNARHFAEIPRLVVHSY
jgi:predicted nucleic acid-binding protein